MSVWVGASHSFSCIAPPTSVVPIIEEEDEFRHIEYMPYLGGLGVFVLIGTGWAINRPKKKKKEEEDEA